MWLLDVNVLLAVAWPNHPFHDAAASWLKNHAQEGFRTCALTQLGFIRISSLPSTQRMASSLAEATEQLTRLCALEVHEFWDCAVSWAEVWQNHGPLQGHQQVNDAYLVALAKAHGGRLVTFDRGIQSLRGAEGVVELLA